MTGSTEIIRLAAKGDGVTAEGTHVPMAVPGDMVSTDGAVTPGPHHVAPPCSHFSACGGCQLQHADDTVLRQFVRDRVVNAAIGQGLDVGEVLDEHLSPPHSRRRATLHALKTAKGTILGFKKAGSHKLVDVKHCPVLTREIADLIGPLRRLIAEHGPRGNIDISIAISDQGVDMGLANFPLEGLGPTEGTLEFARSHALARLTIDQGYGPETVWEPAPVTVTLSGYPVAMPPAAFLQATPDAERIMAQDAVRWVGDMAILADLFAGLGTFSFALAKTGPANRKVLAAEADQAAHIACKSAGARAGGHVLAIHRDLFRNPLQPEELSRFGAVVLDPPRAGAKAQIAQIAKSEVERCVYVSCNPSSWARDAAALVEGGFKLSKVRPVGQFRWSTHVELTSLFER